MTTAIGAKVAFGILALYLSIPLSIIAVQKVAQATAPIALPPVSVQIAAR